MPKQKILTKRPMVLLSSFRMPVTSVSLMREAARQQGISQSEFVRRAIKAEVTKALLEQPPPEAA
jgi:Ribbon-helix-helix protein, copG family